MSFVRPFHAVMVAVASSVPFILVMSAVSPAHLRGRGLRRFT